MNLAGTSSRQSPNEAGVAVLSRLSGAAGAGTGAATGSVVVATGSVMGIYSVGWEIILMM